MSRRPSTAVIQQVVKELASGGQSAEIRRAMYHEMASKGGSTKTPDRARASRANGKLGGKPTAERMAKAEDLKNKFLKAKGSARVDIWRELVDVATRKMVRELWTADLPRPDWL